MSGVRDVLGRPNTGLDTYLHRWLHTRPEGRRGRGGRGVDRGSDFHQPSIRVFGRPEAVGSSPDRPLGSYSRVVSLGCTTGAASPQYYWCRYG